MSGPVRSESSYAQSGRALYSGPYNIHDCGHRIYTTLFFSKAGAKSVTGVDMSDIIHSTTDIIRENNFQDVITLVKGRLEDVKDLQVSNIYTLKFF